MIEDLKLNNVMLTCSARGDGALKTAILHVEKKLNEVIDILNSIVGDGAKNGCDE